ncbi:heavy-metal-associated domain-containing protein [Clostridium sp. cel8]|jgi:copper chaperone|uniref:heavy-metal-associated domain-containing protein n=1 Tax=unclassified Clostridium TaxID=2614128 RepID=UPI0015F5B227|nr:heavy-metal-associated domain-containing protein [Clostridium sp. cel8]MBA5851402.1 heavy-metal-associated domain-containing protein [Clostridium sp. cel8]
MKSIFRVTNMNTAKDINKIRKVIANNEGVIACQINSEKGEVSVVYDNYFVTSDSIIQSVENLGYTVI